MELPNVPETNAINVLQKQIEELGKKKNQIIAEQDPIELLFED